VGFILILSIDVLIGYWMGDVSSARRSGKRSLSEDRGGLRGKRN
jgi:hypothetical protein